MLGFGHAGEIVIHIIHIIQNLSDKDREIVIGEVKAYRNSGWILYMEIEEDSEFIKAYGFFPFAMREESQLSNNLLEEKVYKRIGGTNESVIFRVVGEAVVSKLIKKIGDLKSPDEGYNLVDLYNLKAIHFTVPTTRGELTNYYYFPSKSVLVSGVNNSDIFSFFRQTE